MFQLLKVFPHVKQYLVRSRHATNVGDVFANACETFRQIVGDSCVSVWMWDDRNHEVINAHSFSEGEHAKRPRTLDASSRESAHVKMLANSTARDGEVTFIPNAELKSNVCKNSDGVCFVRVTTVDGIRLLTTACRPKTKGSRFLDSTFSDFFAALTQAMLHAIERIRLRRERELLSEITEVGKEAKKRQYFDDVATVVQKSFNAAGCSVFIIDRDHPDTLILGGTTGMRHPNSGEALNSVTYRRDEGCTGWIFQNLEAVRLKDALNNEEWKKYIPAIEKVGLKSAEEPMSTNKARPFLAMPIFTNRDRRVDDFVGVIRLHGKYDTLFLPSDESRLKRVSQSLGRSISLWQAADERQKLHWIAVRGSEETALNRVSMGIAHELKNGLTTLQSQINALGRLETIREKTQVSEETQSIETEVSKLFESAQSLLRISKPDQTKRARHCINQIIERSKKLIEPTVKKANMELRLNLHPETLNVVVSDSDIYTIFRNLVLNGVDASEENQSIDIKSGRDEDGIIWFSVADSGSGVDAAIANQIFEFGFSSKENGSGCGLYMARNVAQENGGDINFVSSPGRGAKFIVFFHAEDTNNVP